MLEYTRDTGADSLYVFYSRSPATGFTALSDRMVVDVAADGQPVGIELLDVSGGVELDDRVPRRAAIEAILDRLGIPVFA